MGRVYRYRKSTFSTSVTNAATDTESSGIYIDSFFARNNQLSLVNYSTQPITLDGWRFLTSNASVTNIQTAPQGLDGITIQPFNSLRIQLDNNADIQGGINASDIGDFADYQSQAFAITLFCPDDKGQIDFNTPSQAIDHMQWSVNAGHHPIADTQNQLAVDAGLWTAHDDWIDGREHMYLIEHLFNQQSQLNGPQDYEVLLLTCQADLNHDGNINFFDVSTFLNAFAQLDPAADLNNDGDHNFFDVSFFLNAYTTNSGCV